ncbi:unnamed protein product [Triticum turgidum subsp. durum]|uniref:Uncharacterized protein n=1 Tax=Triticum turgidum subsp. durum TaxID=4567 RepID=A0A9R1NJ75_TRITD|nr:unnamed protein product [Triticum turgidum subsp. durum]
MLILGLTRSSAYSDGATQSGFQLKVPLVELKMSLWIKDHLETSSTLKKLLLMLVLYGTSMVIVDGIVTPAMSGGIFALYSLILCRNAKASLLPN